jgi:hypothetical protein
MFLVGEFSYKIEAVVGIWVQDGFGLWEVKMLWVWVMGVTLVYSCHRLCATRIAASESFSVSEWHPIHYKTETLNQGPIIPPYDIQTGVFTAPSSGLYHFDLLAVSKAKGWVGFGIAQYPSLEIIVQTRASVAHEPKTLSVNLALEAGQKIVPAYLGRIDCGPDKELDPAGTSMCRFSGFQVTKTEY